MAGEQRTGKEQQKTVYGILSDAILLAPRLLSSRLALRAYITTILLGIAAVTLIATSIIVYLFFYNLYVPQPGFTKPIHLQFEQGYHPWGTTSLESSAGPALGALVKYDVDLSLHLPRSPINVAAGNFMLELRLNELPEPGPRGSGNLTTSVLSPSYESMRTLAVSRRPAMLKYRSRLVENAKKATVLALYVMDWKEEAETLTLNMMEGVEFGRWRLPKSMRLEVQSSERIQIYWMKVEFRPKLVGLRFLMSNYRVTSFLVFTVIFWGISMGSAIAVWLILAFILKRRIPPSTSLILSKTVKKEPQEDDLEPDLSDTSRTFPTSSRQPLLRYSGSLVSRIKKEEEEESNPNMEADEDAPPLPPRHLLPSPAADADVEDEGADFVLDDGLDIARAGGRSDSGLGTSMESSAASGTSVRRRNSKKRG